MIPPGYLTLFCVKSTEMYPISDKGKLASIINFSSSGTISATVTPGVIISLELMKLI